MRGDALKPDWHVIFNHPGEVSITLNTSPNRVLFAIGEPPTRVHRVLHEGQGEGTVVLTSDPDLAARTDGPRRHVLGPTLTRAWAVKKTYDELKVTSVTEKPKILSWVTSNLSLMSGHRYRLAFLEKIRGQVSFDLYGRGFQPIADKWDGLAPYRYSIAFENTVAPYYFTEKIMDCFVAEVMPIYYGSLAIADFFPAESIVRIDPEDPDVVKIIKDTIASDLWLKRRDAVCEAKRLVLEKYNTFALLAEHMQTATDTPEAVRSVHIRPVSVDFGAD